MSRITLALLMLPIAVGLTGCTLGGADGNTGQLLGQAVTAALQIVAQTQGNGAVNPAGSAAPQPLAASVSSQLPGGNTASTGGSSLLGAFQSPNQPGPFDAQPLTLQSGVTGGSSAPSNALTLANASAQNNVGKANDGRLTLTQYGGPTDNYSDSLTRARKGNRDNTLRPTSLALSANLIREFGLKGGESIYVKTAKGNFFLGTYDDTTGNSAQNNVIDVYDPQDSLGSNAFLASIPPGGWQLAVGPKVA